MWGLPVGNPNLKPEESRSYEMGVEQSFFDKKILMDITYFNTHFKNLIDFVYGTGYINLSKARIYGIESDLKFKKGSFTGKWGYTWLDTENKTNGDELLKRPKNKINLEFNWDLTKWNLNFCLGYVGHRTDYKNKLLKSYFLGNLSLNYKINKNFTMFGRIENLFNEKYEETKDYQTPRFSVYSGFKLEF
jgi:vitamin B12 transporter